MRPRVRFRKNKTELQISSPFLRRHQTFFNARIKRLSAFSNPDFLVHFPQ